MMERTFNITSREALTKMKSAQFVKSKFYFDTIFPFKSGRVPRSKAVNHIECINL